MDIFTPLISFSSSTGRLRISLPLNCTLPSARPFLASRPMTDMKIWLLPEPDSPTMPRVSPALIAKLTSLTARTVPSGVEKVVLRLRTSRMAVMRRGSSTVLGVEGVAQPVADEIEAEQGDRQHGGRPEQRPGRDLHDFRALAHQSSPTGGRLLHAHAEEADEALEQGHLRDGQGDVDHHRPKAVRDDVAGDDPPSRDTTCFRRLDAFPPPDGDGLAADDARHVEPADRADGDVDEGDARPEHDRQHDHEEDEGQRIEDVDDPHHGPVDPPADETGRGAPYHADDQAHHGRGESDHERDLAAI